MLRPLMIVLTAALLIPSAAVRAADGDPDASFSGGSVVAPYPHAYNTTGGLAVLADGKITTAGSTADDTPFPVGPSTTALARYNPDGTLDSSFGTGGYIDSGLPGSGATQLVVQSDGKLVVLDADNSGLILARFDDGGSLDTSFGTGGTSAVGCEGFFWNYVLVVQKDDRLLVSRSDFDAGTACLARFEANGTPDLAFGVGGAVMTSSTAPGLAVQTDGKLVTAGHMVTGMSTISTVARFESDGSVDSGFGDHGVVFGPGYFVAVAVQGNGRIVAVGDTSNDTDLTVARYLANGNPDRSFGIDGLTQTTVTGSASFYSPSHVVLQDDGKVLVAVEGSTPSPPMGIQYDVTLVRYEVDGTLDASFGSGGIQSALSGDPTSLVVQPDGKALIGTNYTFFFGETATIGRFHALTIGCAATALSGCKATIAPGGSQLKLTDSALDPKDQWKSKWTGAATTLAELGDPLATDDYRLCLYDDSNGSAFVSGAILPAGGTCKGKPCWKAKGTTGFGYKDSIGSRFGITALKLKAGGDGGAQIQLQGRGGALPLPPLPVALPLRLQLSSGNGTCWEATFSATGLKRNEAGRFQGGSD